MRLPLIATTILALSSCTHSPEVLIERETSNILMTGMVSIADQSNFPEDLFVSVNGIEQTIRADGQFSIRIADQDVYQLKLSGSDVFDSLHTFSQAELIGKDGVMSVPPIVLVEKKAGRRLLTFGGDAMMGRRYLDPQWNEEPLIRAETRLEDMKSILSEMKPYFEIADYSSINLETILAEAEHAESAPKSVVFYTHPDIIGALEWMGVDYVSLGNNHTYDYLDPGLESTLEYLEGSNLAYSGAGRDETDALKPSVRIVDGLPVSTWGYVGWAGNVDPNQVAEQSKAGAAYGSEANFRKSLDGGTKPDAIDIVQYHGSREYSEGPSESTETRLKMAIDLGADLAIGHHPHVSQGFELYKDKLISYSLGNFAFDQFFYSTHAAIALNVWMDGDQFYRAEIVPLHVKGYKPLPATNSVRTYILDRMIRLSEAHGTIISRSGGHAVVHGDQTETPLSPSGRTDILFVGDFESYTAFEINERNWMAENATFEPTRDARTGRYALKVESIEKGKAVTFGQKTFMRVYPADRMRWQGYVQGPVGTSITPHVQYRPKGMNRYKALDEAPREPLSAFEITHDGWHHIAVDFDAKSWKNNPSRILLNIEGAMGPLKFDDIEIVPVGVPHEGMAQ